MSLTQQQVWWKLYFSHWFNLSSKLNVREVHCYPFSIVNSLVREKSTNFVVIAFSSNLKGKSSVSSQIPTSFCRIRKNANSLSFNFLTFFPSLSQFHNNNLIARQLSQLSLTIVDSRPVDSHLTTANFPQLQ